MSGLFYQLPFQKGYLINWDIESQVWNRIFGKECFNLDFAQTDLVFTEPYFNFTSVKEAVNEVFFEEYQFQSILISNPAALSALEYAATQVREAENLNLNGSACMLVDAVSYIVDLSLLMYCL